MKFSIELTRDELELLAEALDSHAYWQLSEPDERSDGSTCSESDEVQACEKLENRLRVMLFAAEHATNVEA